ncbi:MULTISPECIES: hypothetical protein [Pseudoalteromonas]|uniref:Uncharacterized protein n=1 Tax=Pseudoalteromonas distincta TaxID=77608 RepID=A0A4P9J6K3_9GAMM|nr:MULTISPECIES: hypothetical protein [Pseudoalteromonas]KAA1154404.1 hypothetical protein EU511_17350 [Pseudoalteromonas distincta]MDP4485847.1 hypothetical protein [Pseudoalteromonas elyakovii]QCU76449.1 hypothetical protein FFU37_18475 [Pseudoalteromonas distincta]QQM66044.1 hypothetical protein JG479_19165 [Pseudoalteromonas sp. LC2018020214]
MSQLKCKKCQSSIVARDLTPKGRHRNYVCPLCGTPVNAHKEKYFFIGVLIFIAGLLINAFYLGISSAGLNWISDSYKLLLVILTSSILLVYSIYKNSKYKANSNMVEPRPWPLLTAICTLLIIWTVINL